MAGIMAKPEAKGRMMASIICWFLGIGCLLAWNSMLTIQDYYQYLFPNYHSARVLPIVYFPVVLTTTATLAYYEATLNTRKRIISGFLLLFMSNAAIIILDLATSGGGGLVRFIALCLIVVIVAIAEGTLEGGLFGDLSFMCPEFMQTFLSGMAASGLLTSSLRLITKAAFENTKSGLRNGAMVFLSIATSFMLLCVFLYAFVFAKLPIVKYYRSKAASEGSKTVAADLAAAGMEMQQIGITDEEGGHKQLERLSTKQLLAQNIDLTVAVILTYVLTLSIFPGFISEDTGKHSLGSWYAVVLITVFNLLDLIGRYIPVSETILSRKGLVVAAMCRYLLIPCFYFTARYGSQGWMIFLTGFLGLSNGYLTVCVFAVLPQGYKGPEKNALGNLFALFLLIGVTLGATLDWMWLIGKGW
ncbi:equilibrative nucleotide transporter 3-like isoform X1 [Papaver somniferum]|uniref:equilibrative nucleotide transporter 3-like isoform X1 n=2 Tax=Papaver somniferum TaxID=3469 RepID=UPI000E6FFDD7|nr:equilibrative nucleotide transporter 3-like isoform X1 [Papaver somniferum]